MRIAILVLFGALTACEGASWDKTPVAPPPTGGQTGAQVSQYCTYNGTSDLESLNAFLSRMGASGWQLVGVGGQTATLYCFRFIPVSPR
jgi:hypothetical protein